MEKHIVKLSILGVAGFFLFSLIIGTFSFRSKAVNFEESIRAQYSQNQNNYDNMWKKFKEISQVTDKYSSDLKELYNNAMVGRYGDDGSKALFQWIQEQNPNLNPDTYLKLQSTIEAGRNSFESDQKQLVAKKEQYAKLIRSNSALVFNMVLGFPKIDLDKYSIVTSDKTNEAFETKKDNEIELFK
jgi:hypothetical protein